MAIETLPYAVDEIGVELRRAGRWWLVPAIALAALFLLAVLTVVVIAVSWRQGHRAAAAAVAEEVRRIQAAGQPITTEDLYGYHRVPPGTADITPEWLEAINSFEEQQFHTDGKYVPFVGDGNPEDLRPNAGDNRLASAEAMLKEYDATLQLALAAARLEGECRFPIRFEQGVGATSPHAQRLPAVICLLRLNARVRALSGDTAGALESLEAMYAASEAMDHPIYLFEHLVRLANFTMALEETEWLLNETQLTGGQLARLKAKLQAADLPAGLTAGLIGDRAMAYDLFHHPEILSNEQVTGTKMPLAFGATGQLNRPADCKLFLELLGETIEASREPFPEARQRFELRVGMRLKALVGSRNPLEKMQYVVTALMLPGCAPSFDATALGLARRDALLAAIAAEQYRLETGAYPARLADLAPGYLTAVPSDPYDGQPLRMVAGQGWLAIYSVGKNAKDDGGVDAIPSGNPDPSVEDADFDIVVRVRAKKAASPD